MVKVFRIFSRLFALASALHAVPWLGATKYICRPFACLHTGDFTTPPLFDQRVSALSFVGINEQTPTILGSSSVKARRRSERIFA